MVIGLSLFLSRFIDTRTCHSYPREQSLRCRATESCRSYPDSQNVTVLPRCPDSPISRVAMTSACPGAPPRLLCSVPQTRALFPIRLVPSPSLFNCCSVFSFFFLDSECLFFAPMSLDFGRFLGCRSLTYFSSKLGITMGLSTFILNSLDFASCTLHFQFAVQHV